MSSDVLPPRPERVIALRPGAMRRALDPSQATHRGLTVVGWAFLPLLIACLAGVWIDPRLVTGAPAWLKPAKFALSFAVHALTFAWLLDVLSPADPRSIRRAANTLAWALPVELALLALQAGLGRRSHFNYATPHDRAVFAVLAVGAVLVLWVSIKALPSGVRLEHAAWRPTRGALRRAIRGPDPSLDTMGTPLLTSPT